MAGFHVAVVPVGRIDREESEAAAARAARVWRQPMEVRESLPVPHGSEDPERGQHRAATFIKKLSAEVLKLGTGKLVGEVDPGAAARPNVDAWVFVTDVDLYTAKTEGVFGALLSKAHSAVVSVRRQREAFYRLKTDPNRQRSRLVKELLRMTGRLRGLPECAEPECVLAPTRSVRDLDIKEERFCRNCEQRLFEGRVQL